MYKHQISDCQSACLWNLVATTNLSAYAIKKEVSYKRGSVTRFFGILLFHYLNPSGTLINRLNGFAKKLVFAEIFTKNLTLRSVSLRGVGLRAG